MSYSDDAPGAYRDDAKKLEVAPPPPPLEPFSPSEVCTLTCTNPKFADRWFAELKKMGHDINMGLDWMPTFAVFVGNVWLAEGSGWDRALAVVSTVLGMTHDHMIAEFQQGRSFPDYKRGTLMVVPRGRYGRLALDVLHQQFLNQITRLFPKGYR